MYTRMEWRTNTFPIRVSGGGGGGGRIRTDPTRSDIVDIE